MHIPESLLQSLIMKGIIIYKSKYGATREYAEMLSQKLDLGLIDADQATTETIAKYDYLLIGGSIYIGKFLLKEFLKKHSRILQTKKVFVFFVSAASHDEEVHNNTIALENIPPLMFRNTGRYFFRGKLKRNELSWKDSVLLRMGAMFQKDLREREKMMTDFNAINESNITALVESVKQLTKNEEKSAHAVLDIY